MDNKQNDLLFHVTTRDGKYTFQQNLDGKLQCLRYGQPWCEHLKPSKAIIALLGEIEELRQADRTNHPPSCAIHPVTLNDTCPACAAWIVREDVREIESAQK